YYRPWTEECPVRECPKCGASDFAGEERTFDTWMDSSISPLFICGYADGGADDRFERLYPASIRPQAKDIVRTWLYYTLLRCDKLTGTAPWSEAWIMGYGLDEHGLKMSKSKGNAIDPLPVIERLGADTFRFWNASEVNHGYDFRCSEQKIESAKKFLSKLWNVSRFLSSFEVPDGGDKGSDLLVQDKSERENLQDADRWILGELDALIERCRKGYSEYNFFIPAVAVREFTWNVFAAHYIEMVKGRAYGEEGFSGEERLAAVRTLHAVLHAILRLLAPITPFITEYLWQRMYAAPGGKSIHLETLPGRMPAPGGPDGDDNIVTKAITEFNSMVWNRKKSENLSLKDGIALEVPDTLKPFERDLRAMHNITDNG
ncbi:MAG: class I tRNA ligase family protein, partial [Nitrosopumilaceae archaeon]|nr:class I tRNA ligase family protein [Nitrosopumilaceae archaeon]